jgi:4-amino-4-deoxy-L-arabinose transferase-like glycosyltransferase
MAPVITSQVESVPAIVPVLRSKANTKDSSRRLLLAMLVVALLVGLISAWHGGVLTVGDDGVSYLDLSDAWRNHDWVSAANGCWSPGYPVLLAAILALVHASPFWEPLVVRGLNFAVYIGAIFAFAFFWRELTRSLERRASAAGLRDELPNLSWLVLGLAFFLFFGGEFVGVSLVSPDLALFACVMLVAGMVIRVKDGSTSWVLFAALGAVCAVGYLFKAIMFLLTFVFLGVVFLAAKNKKSVIPRLGTSFAVFLLLSSPWILMLSRAKHRLDYSDVGKLNYLWFASEGFDD